MRLEVVGIAESLPTLSPAAYLGFDVLETAPNRREDVEGAGETLVDWLDNPTGVFAGSARAAAPRLSRSFLFWLEGRGAIREFRAWLDARKGRAVPTWVPTWQQDLSLASDLGAADTEMVIRECGYTTDLFSSPARRHLAFVSPGGAIACREITDSVDNGDGTETLTLASAVGSAFLAGGPGAGLVSFLTLCRLESDAAEIHYLTPTLAECALRFVEIPDEVPE